MKCNICGAYYTSGYAIVKKNPYGPNTSQVTHDCCLVCMQSILNYIELLKPKRDWEQ